MAARVAPARVAATMQTAARAPAARMVATRTGAARPCRLWQTVGGVRIKSGGKGGMQREARWGATIPGTGASGATVG